MKRILILSYFFPPCNLVGAQRPGSWYRYFHRFGLYPVVITRHWQNEIRSMADASLPDNRPLQIEKHEWGEVHYLPYNGSPRDRFLLRHKNAFSFVRKVVTVWEMFAAQLSFLFNPYRSFLAYAKTLATPENNFSALVVSANPYLLFAVGYRFSKETGIPWIADYRDDWTTNTRYKKRDIVHRTLRIFEKRNEKKWLSNSQFFISVTDAYIQKISALVSKPGYLVLNGFDEQQEFPSVPYKDSLVLLYAGTVYDKQDFAYLVQGIATFLEKETSHVHIIFAGAVIGETPPINLAPFSSLPTHRVSMQILARMGQSELESLLDITHAVFTVPYGKQKGEMPAKLFHYLAWGKPIILAGSDEDIMAGLIHPYSLGYVCDSPAGIAAALVTLTNKLKKGPIVPTQSDLQYVRTFRRENQARIFTEIIHKHFPSPSLSFF